MTGTAILIGLHPDVVDYSDPAYANFPGLDASILGKALERDGEAQAGARLERVSHTGRARREFRVRLTERK